MASLARCTIILTIQFKVLKELLLEFQQRYIQIACQRLNPLFINKIDPMAFVELFVNENNSVRQRTYYDFVYFDLENPNSQKNKK